MSQKHEKTKLSPSNDIHYGTLDSDDTPSLKNKLSYDGPSFKKSWSVSGGSLSFHNIHYTVKVSDGKFKKKDKVILNDINGVFGPGMNAIMGPTGGGKTSLLDVLAGRKDKQGLSGTVLINGLPQPADFRLISGYVIQDDVVMATLTVRENLAFSAALRLPRSVTEEEREQRIEDVIQELGLQDCANTRIGGDFTRGVSGGERKRTNVGMELIIKPSILFMDEPTTGLDASTAGSVMSTMAQLSHRGRTAIFSIHQPRYGIFRLFDKLHLLSKGETVYHGPATEALDYFSSFGYVCEEHNNPADFFLDVILQNQAAVMSSAIANPDYGDEASEDAERGDRPRADTTGRHTALTDYFRRTKYFKDMEHETQNIYESFQNKDDISVADIGYPTSFLTQLAHCGKRSFLNYIRNPKSFIGQTMLVCFFALIVGTIFFQLGMSATSGIQDRVGAFFFIVMNTIMMNNAAVEPFMQERVVFMHESVSGFYRCSSYYIAKLVADLLPQRTLPTLLFATITYWMIGLQKDIIKYLIYTLDLLVSTYAACAIFFLIGASVSDFAIAQILIAVSFIFQMLFAGFLINIESLPSWLSWMEYTSLIRYSYKVVSINELKDQVFCDPYPLNATCIPGNLYLTQQGIDYSTWGLWQNFVAMGSICIGFVILAYIRLRTIPKFK
ncbi:broad substrate specificity ATP-binding cassette transporter ABCG2-like [Amphiura filiformis]|uniref:broad substrate specificity ATP-binding cassette transporter ABCG2-like n=1 Tax=Amphiura filiformis TaxID=82378 RepID=UPI003B220E17